MAFRKKSSPTWILRSNIPNSLKTDTKKLSINSLQLTRKARSRWPQTLLMLSTKTCWNREMISRSYSMSRTGRFVKSRTRTASIRSSVMASSVNRILDSLSRRVRENRTNSLRSSCARWRSIVFRTRICSRKTTWLTVSQRTWVHFWAYSEARGRTRDPLSRTSWLCLRMAMLPQVRPSSLKFVKSTKLEKNSQLTLRVKKTLKKNWAKRSRARVLIRVSSKSCLNHRSRGSLRRIRLKPELVSVLSSPLEIQCKMPLEEWSRRRCSKRSKLNLPSSKRKMLYSRER